jgi:hypothetical protein
MNETTSAKAAVELSKKTKPLNLNGGDPRRQDAPVQECCKKLLQMTPTTSHTIHKASFNEIINLRHKTAQNLMTKRSATIAQHRVEITIRVVQIKKRLQLNHSRLLRQRNQRPRFRMR